MVVLGLATSHLRKFTWKLKQVRHGDQPWYPHVLWPHRHLFNCSRHTPRCRAFLEDACSMQALIWSAGFGPFDQNARDKEMNCMKSRAVSTHSPDWSSSSEKSAGKSSGLAARYKYKCNYHCCATLHNTTLHYTNYITLRYYYNCSCNYNCNYHYIALHNTRLTTLHFTTTTTTTTLPYVTLH